MGTTNINATYCDGHGKKVVVVSMDQCGMQACGFIYDIQQARMLLIQLAACIKKWEQAEQAEDVREFSEVSSNG